MREGKPKVLFLCGGNSCRSQMAEALLRRAAGERFEVHSAGLEPKGIHPLTVKVLEEIGLDLGGHRSKPVGEYLGRAAFAYAIAVCEPAAEACPRIFPTTTHILAWPFDDPARAEGSEEEKLAVFRRVRDEIQTRIERWLVELDG